jgi:hypothetical protein
MLAETKSPVGNGSPNTDIIPKDPFWLPKKMGADEIDRV